MMQKILGSTFNIQKKKALSTFIDDKTAEIIREVEEYEEEKIIRYEFTDFFNGIYDVIGY